MWKLCLLEVDAGETTLPSMDAKYFQSEFNSIKIQWSCIGLLLIFVSFPRCLFNILGQKFDLEIKG